MEATAVSDKVLLRINADVKTTPNNGAAPPAAAYVFSAGGRFLTSSKLGENGHADIGVSGSTESQNLRVMIGPLLERDPESAAELIRRGVAEAFIRINPKQDIAEANITLDPSIWTCWIKGLSLVRGTLNKRVLSGGISVDLPVRNATVEIYEVDPLFIVLPKFPDIDIERIRDLILHPKPIPRPLPDPPPFDSIGLEPFIDRSSPDFELAPSRRSEEVRRVRNVALEPRMPADLKYLAETADTFAFRQALPNFELVVKPIICWYFPKYFTKQLIGTTTTDDCGRFNHYISIGCSTDKPDLYFIAKQRIFNFLTITILERTPVPCHTWWNYVSGTEVTLITTSPFAITSNVCPNVLAGPNWVLMTAVGNYPAQLVEQNPVTTNYGRATDPAPGVPANAPFGGLLRFRLEFDPDLRQAPLLVRYYQMSYRRKGESDWKVMSAAINRHYTHEVANEPVLEVWSVGPKTVGTTGNLFEIPPALPPVGVWATGDIFEDTTSAKFITTDLPDKDGLYEVKVDLFDNTGQVVNLASKGINYFVPDVTDLTGTITTQDASSLVQGNSFVMTVQVDNNPCVAEIGEPSVNGTPANDCGVMRYQRQNGSPTGTLAMPFEASHPNGLANYGFVLKRGAHVVQQPADPVSNLPDSGSVGTGLHSVVEDVADVLSVCPTAGFAEILHVHAMATNGISRLSGLDARDERAFVLTRRRNA